MRPSRLRNAFKGKRRSELDCTFGIEYGQGSLEPKRVLLSTVLWVSFPKCKFCFARCINYVGSAGDVIKTVRVIVVGLPGFEPGTSCTPSKRASQAAPQPELPSVAPATRVIQKSRGSRSITDWCGYRSHKRDGRTCSRIKRTAAATRSALSRACVPSGNSVMSSNPVRIPCPLSNPRRLTAHHAMP